MLQRLTEDLEYSEVLDRAAACHSSLEQMCYVAAFTVSSYSTTSHRTGKPFNPLLGETYECDRSMEKGWRSLAEQVYKSCATILVPLLTPEPCHSCCACSTKCQRLWKMVEFQE